MIIATSIHHNYLKIRSLFLYEWCPVLYFFSVDVKLSIKQRRWPAHSTDFFLFSYKKHVPKTYFWSIFRYNRPFTNNKQLLFCQLNSRSLQMELMPCCSWSTFQNAIEKMANKSGAVVSHSENIANEICNNPVNDWLGVETDQLFSRKFREHFLMLIKKWSLKKIADSSWFFDAFIGKEEKIKMVGYVFWSDNTVALK